VVARQAIDLAATSFAFALALAAAAVTRRQLHSAMSSERSDSKADEHGSSSCGWLGSLSWMGAWWVSTMTCVCQHASTQSNKKDAWLLCSAVPSNPLFLPI